jgi:hypothetical protein
MQEGDHIAMHGNWANFAGSDGMIIDLFAGASPKDEGAGHWTEWFNNGPYGTTVGFGNARLRRVGECHFPQHVDTSDIEKLAVELSDKMKPRLRKDGKLAASPSDPEQVPLPEGK